MKLLTEKDVTVLAGGRDPEECSRAWHAGAAFRRGGKLWLRKAQAEAKGVDYVFFVEPVTVRGRTIRLLVHSLQVVQRATEIDAQLEEWLSAP